MSTIRLSLTDPYLSRIASNLIIIITLVSSIAYFFLTRKSDIVPVKQVRLLGRYFLMIALGSGLGSTAVYRNNLFVGKLYELLAPKMRIYTYVLGLLILLLLAIMYKTGKAEWQR